MSSTEAPNSTETKTLDSWFIYLSKSEADRSAVSRVVHRVLDKQISRVKTVKRVAGELGYRETGKLLIDEARKALGR